MTSMRELGEALKPRLRECYVAALAVGVVFGFPFGTMSQQLVSILAIVGLVLLVRDRSQLWRDERIRLWFFLFVLLWLPMLLSLFGASALQRSMSVTLRYLTYGLAGVALIRGLRGNCNRGAVTGVLIVLLFWTFDALLQYFVGFDLRGFPYQRGQRLTGLFYPWPDIGYFMAVLSPLVFEGIRQWSRRWRFVWLLLLPWLAVILLSGQRVALMMLVLGCVGYGVHLYLIGRAVIAKRLAVPLLVVVAIGGVVASEVEVVRERLVAVEDVFSGNYEAANKASSLRLPLWEAGLRMFQAHWINGVGPRGYSEMVQRYVEPGSVWSKRRAGHPHLFVLEVAAETGLIGLVGYVLTQGVLLVLFFRLRGEARVLSGPWLLVALLASFPLASTISFYASASSSLFWVPLGVAVAFLPQGHFKKIVGYSPADVRG